MGMHFTRGEQSARLFGAHEIRLRVRGAFPNPYFENDVRVEFTRPDGSAVEVETFYDGGDEFAARAYCDKEGLWAWRVVGETPLAGPREGVFHVIPSRLRGKLRRHPHDPHQFAYANGDWFLHIGDTGYRVLIDTEPHWREYLDQAVISGITKVRAWFCRGRSDVQDLFQHDRKGLNLGFWQEIDRRLIHALTHYPDLALQLIPFGEDDEEIERHAAGDPSSAMMIRYAQNRFSGLPNIHWCISNDLKVDPRNTVPAERAGQKTASHGRLRAAIDAIGQAMALSEPWGTLITNHQARFTGYSFTDATWSDIVTLEDLGEVTGALISRYRARAACPVVLDEDRYESWRSPRHDRYFFRRLMWASLLSGGHATYGGTQTFVQYDGGGCGMYGYYDACRLGLLEQGAHDFRQIHRFFETRGIDLVGMLPDDAAAGDSPLRVKVMRSPAMDRYIAYLANPDVYENHEPDGFNGNYTDEIAAPSSEVPEITLHIPASHYTVRWFHPQSGAWSDGEDIASNQEAGTSGVDSSARLRPSTLRAPGGGDWVLLVEQKV